MSACFPLVAASAILFPMLNLSFPSAKAASLATTEETQQAKLQPEDLKPGTWKAVAKHVANKFSKAVKECTICKVFKNTCDSVALWIAQRFSRQNASHLCALFMDSYSCICNLSTFNFCHKIQKIGRAHV